MDDSPTRSSALVAPDHAGPQPGRRRRWHRPVAIGLTVATTVGLLAGCAGKELDKDGKSAKEKLNALGDGKETALSDDGKTPKRGGKLVMSLSGETNGGYCLPEAQLASGIQVAMSIYDTLTVPDDKGGYAPYLAESVDHDASYSTWTIKIRKGVKFHDGSDLTPEVVKNNLDAYRGAYPARKPLLFIFTFQNIADVKVDGDAVVVTTKKPWVKFPAFLFSSGRLGMMAQAQLDDTESCDRKMIGTGPFELKSWKIGTVMTLTKNPDYWVEAPDGKPYPYLDEVDYRIIPDEGQRLSALQAGEVDYVNTGLGASLTRGAQLEADGKADMNVIKRPIQTGHLMMNASRPPFDDPLARKAVAYASNAAGLNDLVNDGLFQLANGPFGPGNIGRVEKTPQPTFNLKMARKLVKQYEKKTGKKFQFALNTLVDPTIMSIAQYAQQNYGKAGMKVKLSQMDQATIINQAIGGQFQASLFTNSFSGGDPDEQYNWWYSTSPVNFGRIKDPIIDKLLDQGRSEPDEAKRKKIYQDLDVEFGKQNWNIWTYYTRESMVVNPKVHGLVPPKLPSGDKPYSFLIGALQLHAAWKE